MNVDASITNVDATALEILEKSPGVVIDKDGNISLKRELKTIKTKKQYQAYLEFDGWTI